MVSSSRENRDFWMTLAVAAMIGALLFSLMPISRMLRAENDFVHWYIGAKLFGPHFTACFLSRSVGCHT